MSQVDPVVMQTTAGGTVVTVTVPTNPVAAVAMQTESAGTVVTVTVPANPTAPVVMQTAAGGTIVELDIETPPRNVVLVVLSNVGLASLGAYDDHNEWPAGFVYAPTPWLDGKIADGIRYTRARSHGHATPSLAAMMTGRTPHLTAGHTGTGLGSDSAETDAQTGIPVSMLAWPYVVGATTPAYAREFFGQWDVGDKAAGGARDLEHPIADGGFQKSHIHDHLRGTIATGGPHFGYFDFAEGIAEEGESLITNDPVSSKLLPTKTTERVQAFFAGIPTGGNLACVWDASAIRGVLPALDPDLGPSLETLHTTFSESQLYPAATTTFGFPDARWYTSAPNNPTPDPEDGPCNVVWRRAIQMVEVMDSLLALAEASLSPAQAANTTWIVTSSVGLEPSAIQPLQDKWQNTTHGAHGWLFQPPTIANDGDDSPANTYYDWHRAAGSVYEAGVRVPLVVAGPSIPADVKGSDCAALIESADIYPTVLQLITGNAWISEVAAAGQTAHIDGVSFAATFADPDAAPRAHSFSEYYAPQGSGSSSATLVQRKVVNVANWAYIVTYTNPTTSYALYDLDADPRELTNLYPPVGGEATTQYNDLLAEMAARTA